MRAKSTSARKIYVYKTLHEPPIFKVFRFFYENTFMKGEI